MSEDWLPKWNNRRRRCSTPECCAGATASQSGESGRCFHESILHVAKFHSFGVDQHCVHVCKPVGFYERAARALLLTLQYGILRRPRSDAECLKEGSVPTDETVHLW